MKKQTVTQDQIETVKALVLKAIEKSNESTIYKKMAQIETKNNEGFVTLDIKIELAEKTKSLLDIASMRSILIQVKPRSFEIYYDQEGLNGKKTKSRLKRITYLMKRGYGL
jgi:hypothetical protein